MWIELSDWLLCVRGPQYLSTGTPRLAGETDVLLLFVTVLQLKGRERGKLASAKDPSIGGAVPGLGFEG